MEKNLRTRKQSRERFKRKRREWSRDQIALFLTLAAGSVFMLFPLVYAFFGAFKTTEEFLAGGPNLFPAVWSAQNFITAWEAANFSRYSLNSILLAVGAVLGTLIVASLAGYVLARADLPGKNLILGMFTATLFVTGAVTIYPTFNLANRLHLTESLLGMIVAEIAASLSFNTILVTAYARGISRDLDDAARIDGCGHWGIYWHIMLPLIRPILGTVGLLQFRNAWNSYLIPLAFSLARPELRPLTVGILSLKDQGEGISSWNLMAAGTVFAIVPILVAYLFVNRQFIAGITEGAVKG